MAMQAAQMGMPAVGGAITGEMLDKAAEISKQQGNAKWEECKCECSGDCFMALCCPCLHMQETWKKLNMPEEDLQKFCIGMGICHACSFIMGGRLFIIGLIGNIVRNVLLCMVKNKYADKWGFPKIEGKDYLCVCCCYPCTTVQDRNTAEETIKPENIMALVGGAMQAGMMGQVMGAANAAMGAVGGMIPGGGMGGSPDKPPMPAQPQPGAIVYQQDQFGNQVPMQVQPNGQLMPMQQPGVQPMQPGMQQPQPVYQQQPQPVYAPQPGYQQPPPPQQQQGL